MAVSYVDTGLNNDASVSSTQAQTFNTVAVGDMIILAVTTRHSTTARTVSSLSTMTGCTAWIQRRTNQSSWGSFGTTVVSSQIGYEVWYCFVQSGTGQKTTTITFSGSVDKSQCMMTVLRGVLDQNYPFATNQAQLNVQSGNGSTTTAPNGNCNPSIRTSTFALFLGFNSNDGVNPNVTVTGGTATIAGDTTDAVIRTFGAYKTASSDGQAFSSGQQKYNWEVFTEQINGDVAQTIIAGAANTVIVSGGSSGSVSSPSAAVGDMIVCTFATMNQTLVSAGAKPVAFGPNGGPVTPSGCTAFVQRFLTNYHPSAFPSWYMSYEVWYCFVTVAGVKSVSFATPVAVNTILASAMLFSGVLDQANPWAQSAGSATANSSSTTPSTMSCPLGTSTNTKKLGIAHAINDSSSQGLSVLSGANGTLFETASQTDGGLHQTRMSYKANPANSTAMTWSPNQYVWIAYSDMLNGDAAPGLSDRRAAVMVNVGF